MVNLSLGAKKVTSVPQGSARHCNPMGILAARPLGILGGAAGLIKASIIAEETSGQGLGTRPLGFPH